MAGKPDFIQAIESQFEKPQHLKEQRKKRELERQKEKDSQSEKANMNKGFSIVIRKSEPPVEDSVFEGGSELELEKGGEFIEESFSEEGFDDLDDDDDDIAKSKEPHMTKEDKNPKGGLSAKGRKKLNAAGKNIKPGVKGAADTPEKQRRKGQFLTRFYGRKDLHPFKDDKGELTRFALAANEWGEKPPQNAKEARALAAKGRKLLERYEKSKEKES